MIFLFGKRKKKIKEYTDNNIKCKSCGSFTYKFTVYQTYYHFFFIPVFTGTKTIHSHCANCNDNENGEKKDFYLSKTKTPFYMYPIPILLMCLFVLFLIPAPHKEHGVDIEKYVHNPEVNDVYLIKTENLFDDNNDVYYFKKLKQIKGDTLYLMDGILAYEKVVTTMARNDYFSKSKYYAITKAKLINMLNDDKIKYIARDYDKNSQFRIEK